MDFFENFSGSVIVSDKKGNIIHMNEKAAITFKDDGGRALIGRNLFDCHKESSNEKIREMLDIKRANVYTIEKNGVKKLIYQAPWFRDGEVGGLIELSLEIPFEMPHFKRD
jgi:transcriptional regulator with PAS, ATPase and Fis domain